MLRFSTGLVCFNWNRKHSRILGIAAELVPRLVGSVKRGFFCDDETIMYPYRADTFTPTFLFTYCILLVIVVVSGLFYYRRLIYRYF